MVVTEDGDPSTVSVVALPGGRRRIQSSDGELDLRVRITGPEIEVETDDRIVHGTYCRVDDTILLMLAGETYAFMVGSELAAVSGGAGMAGGSNAVLASMPGVVAEVKVEVGDMVEAGQVVVVLESMKLFASLPAGITGVVVDVACQSGETVLAGKRLIVIKVHAED